jgi:hypothetical protein
MWIFDIDGWDTLVLHPFPIYFPDSIFPVLIKVCHPQFLRFVRKANIFPFLSTIHGHSLIFHFKLFIVIFGCPLLRALSVLNTI